MTIFWSKESESYTYAWSLWRPFSFSFTYSDLFLNIWDKKPYITLQNKCENKIEDNNEKICKIQQYSFPQNWFFNYGLHRDHPLSWELKWGSEKVENSIFVGAIWPTFQIHESFFSFVFANQVNSIIKISFLNGYNRNRHLNF